MKINCPNCNNLIPNEDLNVSTDLGKCSNCDTLFKLSEVAFGNKELSLSPPIGSSLIFIEGFRDSYEITLPAKGFKTTVLPVLIFNIFWLGFVAFWTIGAASFSFFFALFSVPFWFVGVGMFANLITKAYGHQKLLLNRNGLVLEKISPIWKKYNEWDLNEIVSLELKTKAINRSNKRNNNILDTGSNPAIVSGKGTDYFFDVANDAEKEWVVSFLNAKVKELKR